MPKVFITTLGCKVNQFESASFTTGFEEAGLQVVGNQEKADIVVINSCAVTAAAGAQSRQLLRKMARDNPQAKIIFTGCYAELAADRLSEEGGLAGRDFAIIGNSKKDDLVKTALGSIAGENNALGKIGEATKICSLPIQRFNNRVRAYLRIQDGCESYCSYCIVPYTRGPSRSLPLQAALRQAEIFAAAGHREIVLTGIHIGNYGKDLQGREDLLTLLDSLTRATPQVGYRISSLEPTEITDGLLELMAERKNLLPHLHIPLQSGNDEILQKMNRRYSTATYQRIVEKCNARIADLAVGIDILAGFPGESEDHFNSAFNFLRALEFSYLHVFPYSIRPGTPAAKFAGQVEKRKKEQRVAKLRKLSDDKRQSFYKRQLGRKVRVLVETGPDSDGLLKGYTDNYVAVRFAGDLSLRGQHVRVKLSHLMKAYVQGEYLGPDTR
ncbi:MAG: tRNA (N(6)-L-threonylcarbamoyladenosine(37)-C(2))-methylthiotransferase MtaB [Deltaproteobacteria bacterium]|nr:MAG: tRNA (N(6)-L-threonylcarbamoyladenosine(37)-C(2))-methylthiotransferase MtaB [Deltaproteobacteria bacterium]